ncbi:uncharacterized protein Z519_02324 [Cladophialophora bantiana CBS 173.52]|uniref:Uncharacterized protein n=1 Tax=Cladophialophora bantiana (strain ATCC 10958 / CBS 173.52 / CDC B-1940 / NIH 8579) TaxID=1442370 RepID=A0A0D2HU36_CLAB1|nr:uncharacterized protein Z519_02324 [Cladophialophora bantiana CBS 173.52]KIW96933.1 hypothetical protein Z519_02324 [Cladophialophora bantiana CBS 173.52]
MAPRSPTHAFDPTPALEHDPDNFSPLNHPRTMNSSFDPRAVRFSNPPSMPIKGRHSIATTNVPLLPPVSSASQLPKHGFQMTNPTPEVDITAYMEQCRLWNTQLRQSHESERKAWAIERTALKARIGELEQKLNKSRDPKRRSSNDSTTTSLRSFKSDFQPFGVNGKHRPRISPEATITEPPVWKGPESTPPVTRVFASDDEVCHLPSISEDEAMPALSKEVSPTSGGQENIPIPIEKVDNTLDGITLKSAALTSSFDKEITSPQFASPALSPVPQPNKEEPLRVDVSTLISPLDEKLKRHAGHTPMAFDGTLSSDVASNALTPKQENPLAPAPTQRPPLRPSENSDSYFSLSSAPEEKGQGPQETEEEPEPVHDTNHDPPLKGPLMLDPNAKTVESVEFLNILDGRLIEEKEQQDRAESNLSGGRSEEQKAGCQQQGESSANDDDMPRLRMRNSVNFGSAWGRI